MKLPQFIVLVSLTVGPQLPSWQSLFSHGLTCQGGCLPFAPWPQLLVHLQRWAAVRIEPLVGKAAEALLLVAAVEARLLRNIHIYIYILCIHSLEMVEEPDLRMREPKGVGMFPGEVPWLFAASPHIVLLTISIRLQVPHPKKKKS